MTLKKKWKVAAISCAIGLCSVGQQVFASDTLFQPPKGDNGVDQLIQRKLLEEQEQFKERKALVKKLNIERQIEKVQKVKGLKSISTRDKAILTRIVEAEATDKDIKSKILVANVILNRVRSKEFPNSVEKVVFQRTNGSVQFSPTADGRYNSVTIKASTRESVERALEGEDYSEGALYFVEKTMANPRNVSWFDRALTKLFTYQGHSFYK
ncbi:cell wall hydrolase [Anaerostipes sp.]|uniref:cell wall hydrolase n=1 Tax=Anaerostipes sp. TaxID=1872530 RepID=UPI0025B90379|nr:cell wall hydrolase [Anaerostipes sp.]MBS7008350.1 cell wall hydrolase [Anaerostipes sp.]